MGAAPARWWRARRRGRSGGFGHFQRCEVVVFPTAQGDGVPFARNLLQAVDIGEERQAVGRCRCQQLDATQMGDVIDRLGLAHDASPFASSSSILFSCSSVTVRSTVIVALLRVGAVVPGRSGPCRDPPTAIVPRFAFRCPLTGELACQTATRHRQCAGGRFQLAAQFS